MRQHTTRFTGSIYLSGSVGNKVDFTKSTRGISGSFSGSYVGFYGGDTLVSSSAQTIASLPAGVISGSGNLSASLPPGTMSGSAQTKANLPVGVISGSAQITSGSDGLMSGSVQTAENLPTNTLSGSMGEFITGSFSGSATSTGSFGSLTVAGKTSTTGNISSSAILTAKNVNIAGASADTLLDIDSTTVSHIVHVLGTAITQLSGSLQVTGSIKTTENVSGSASSTGSFAQILVGGSDGSTAFAVISGSGASGVVRISGSAESTGSFGNLQVLGKTIKIEEDSIVNQDLTTDATPTFAGLISTGTITAQEIHTVFISASIAKATGSTTFGDDSADTHQFTGSLQIGSVVGEKTTIASASVSGSSTSTGSFGKVEATTITGIIPSVLSGSAQVTANLPTGVISGSGNLSASLPPGTVSASAQLSADISGSSGNKATPGFAIAMSVAL